MLQIAIRAKLVAVRRPMAEVCHLEAISMVELTCQLVVVHSSEKVMAVTANSWLHVDAAPSSCSMSLMLQNASLMVPDLKHQHMAIDSALKHLPMAATIVWLKLMASSTFKQPQH